MFNVAQQWNRCLDVIKANIPAEQFNAWFAPIVAVDFDPETDRVTLRVPSQFFVEKIEDRYITILSAALRKVFGENVKNKTTIDGKNGIFYSLRIRTFDEVENYSKKKLIAIDDDLLSESDLVNIKLLDDNQKMIYKNIKNQELNSIKELEDNYTGIDSTRIVHDLLELNLIEYKEIYQLDDYQ